MREGRRVPEGGRGGGGKEGKRQEQEEKVRNDKNMKTFEITNGKTCIQRIA